MTVTVAKPPVGSGDSTTWYVVSQGSVTVTTTLPEVLVMVV